MKQMLGVLLLVGALLVLAILPQSAIAASSKPSIDAQATKLHGDRTAIECAEYCVAKGYGVWGHVGGGPAGWYMCTGNELMAHQPSHIYTSSQQACDQFWGCMNDDCWGGGASIPTVTLESPPTELPPLPSTPQLGVSASPKSFSEVGEEIELVVTVLDLQGIPVAGELVQVVSTEPQGEWVQANTDVNGISTFTLMHYDAQVINYKYFIKAAGIDKWLDIPVSTADITLEINPNTGEAFQGVVADGVSTLKITLNFPHLAGNTVKFTTPELGSLQGDVVLEIYNEIQLDNSGRAEITYQPPDYLIDRNLLSKEIYLRDFELSPFPAWSAIDTINFTYAILDGTQRTAPLEIQVFRPPVMLVHGFTADDSTWWSFASYLSTEKFDPVLGDYTSTSEVSSIEDLSPILHRIIQQQKTDYWGNNIKLTKVDVVAHSMGGLITRNYVEETGYYGQDVRKIIMVATPNHGIGWAEKPFAIYYTADYNYHWKAAFEMFSSSDFIRRLNAGEAVGQHLNMDIEYANLMGQRLSISPLDGAWEFETGQIHSYAYDDVTVANSSSHINGVVEYTYKNLVHSNYVVETLGKNLGTPITENQEIFDKIHSLLLSEIFHPPLRGTSMIIHRGDGDVSIRAAGGDWQAISSYPTGFEPWYDVRTKEGRATIDLYLNDNLWGLVSMRENTELVFDYSSPELVRVWLKSGSARFRSLLHDAVGNFDILVGQGEEKWDEFQPRARIRGFGTDFVVEVGANIQTYVLEGQVGVESTLPETAGSAQMLSAQEGNKITPGGAFESIITPPEPWWEAEIFETSDIESGTLGDSGLWTFFYVSACGWILVAGGLVVIVLLSRKRTFARWLLPLSIGAIILCTISTCVLGFMAFGSSPQGVDSPVSPPQPPAPENELPTNPPPAETAPVAAPTKGANQVELTLTNDLSEEVCFVLISPSGSEEWGDDWLGDDEILPAGYTLTLSIPPGTYDLAALDCDENVLVRQLGGEVISDTEWTLVEE